MIISRTPLRISLGGGGTDLPSYFMKSGGFLVAAAINKHIYVSIHDNFVDRYLLKYSQIEDTDDVNLIKHPLIREALIHTSAPANLEISSLADIPAGTGLGSSGTFTVGLLKALTTYQKNYKSNHQIAEEACFLEIEKLKEPVGKQDQFIAAIGGLTAFEFQPDGRVNANSIRMDPILMSDFEENLLLFYTGIQRSASEELSAIDIGASVQDSKLKQNLDEVKAAGYLAAETLENGDLLKYARMLTIQWDLKFQRSPGELHQKINQWIQHGINNGALGGKLVGAGGGGFLLFFAENKTKLRTVMREIGLREVPFNFDHLGSVIVQ
jgi:D-glycero-alpha-D-manno-heptose-7-phosphate kinase